MVITALAALVLEDSQPGCEHGPQTHCLSMARPVSPLTWMWGLLKGKSIVSLK